MWLKCEFLRWGENHIRLSPQVYVGGLRSTVGSILRLKSLSLSFLCKNQGNEAQQTTNAYYRISHFLLNPLLLCDFFFFFFSVAGVATKKKITEHLLPFLALTSICHLFIRLFCRNTAVYKIQTAFFLLLLSLLELIWSLNFCSVAFSLHSAGVPPYF